MKRVYCLYRVSTIAQVEKDDIPMQKQSCREFAERQGWEVCKEFSEKGVSGFKVSAANRDAIQQIKEDALQGKFDVLLVFMFDRIGRIESETPFVVEWFVQKGIEVWSVNEGEQRFENHVDKLMNYIRFWQASGESEKTSIRTKTRLGQIVKEGRFRGGVVPYGYRIEKQGRMNKKNHEVYEIFTDEYEAAIVKIIFDRYVNAGYGTRRIATYVDGQGYKNRKGKKFHGSSVLNMLKNPAYRGVLRSGESFSEPFEHLRIIDDDTFNRAQEMIKERGAEYGYKCRHAKIIKGQGLLSGNVFCGHCGSRLHANSAKKIYSKKNGEEVVTKKYLRYSCYTGTRDKDLCDGQVTYKAEVIDDAVECVVRELFDKLQGVSYGQVIENQYKSKLKECEINLNKAKSLQTKHMTALVDLKAEIVNAIRGVSKWSAELLNEAITQTEMDLKDASAAVVQYEDEILNSHRLIAEVKSHYDNLLNWAAVFDDCEFEEKKMIVSNIISTVNVSRGPTLEVNFKISMEQFLGEVDVEEPTEAAETAKAAV